MKLHEARRMWAQRQGLRTQSDTTLHDVVYTTGWLRALGGCEPYVALGARASSASVSAVHEAIASRDLQVLPAVRGCMYIVPRADAGLALATAKLLSQKRRNREAEICDYDDRELDRTGELVLDVLASGPLTTAQLKKALPDGAFRKVDGKKVGISSTLAPALRHLEFQHRIERQPIGHRLDHERYTWAPASAPAPEPENVAEALAERFLRWAAPATRQAFAAWSGLGQKQAKAALEAIGAVEVEVEELGTCYLPGDSVIPEPTDATAFLGGLDNLYALHLTPAPLVDPPHRGIELSTFGRPASGELGATQQLFDRVVAKDGRLVGAWAPSEGIEVHGFPGEHAPEAPEWLTSIFEDLGHDRTMCLDSEATAAARLERVRASSS